jgi:ribose-phosphate pyrophosphokinase
MKRDGVSEEYVDERMEYTKEWMKYEHIYDFKIVNEEGKLDEAILKVADIIKNNIPNALLIGPDSESEQWVSEVAKAAGAPFIVLQKIRRGDNDVEVSVPQTDKYKEHTPVLVDDIISTANTMIETIGHLKKANMKPAVCIGVHAVFANSAYDNLIRSGIKEVITCNTIFHISNKIDVSGMIIDRYNDQ